MAPEAVAGKRILLVRGEGGRELLPGTLEERGAEVVRLPVYRRRCPDADPAPVSEALAAGRLDAGLLTSPEAFTNLLALLPPPDREALTRVLLVAISPVTARTVTEAGFPEPAVAGEASSEGLLSALTEHCPAHRDHEEGGEP
jgi:uroporphyrinogen-III synthase